MDISSLFTIAGWVAVALLVIYIFFVVSMRSQGRPARI